MTVEMIIRLGLLYAHLLLCAFAICYVLSADIRILKGVLLRDELSATAHRMVFLLLALWGTGLPIVLIDLGGDLTLLPTKAKLCAKLVCVSVLSLNAVVLHKFAFPHLVSGRKLPENTWRLVMCTGAVSTTSWLFAAFLGIAKPLANVLTFGQFLGLYLTAILVALLVALMLATPLQRRIGSVGGGAATATA